MEVQVENPEIWLMVAAVAFLPFGFYLTFRMLTAKSRKVYFTSVGLLFLAGLVFAVGITKLFDPPTKETIERIPDPAQELMQLPWPALAFLGLIVVIWIGGGNWILIRQARKAGRPWWSPLNPFNPPFRDMDGKAWLRLVLLAVLVFAIFLGVADLIEILAGP